METIINTSVSNLINADTTILFNQYAVINSGLYSISAEDDTDNCTLYWVCSFITVKQVILNENTQHFNYALALQTAHGEKTCIIPKDTITSRNLEQLTAYGFNFDYHYTNLILKYLTLCEESAECITEYSYVGFKGDSFYGYSKNDNSSKKYTGNIQLCESESYDITLLNSLTENAPMLRFAITVSASSALLGYLGQEIALTTPIIHFYGDTSVGKTTALIAGISVWGKPVLESGMLSTWNQTENALTERLCNNFAVPIALDESSICNFNLTKFIYNLSQGMNRQRLQKNMNQAPTKQWLTTILSSGESSLLEHCNENGGLRVRVFEFNDQISLSASHSNSVKSFCLFNYGYIGKKFVEQLEKATIESMIAVYNECKKSFMSKLNENAILPITDRIADYYSIWIVTAKYLNEMGLCIEPDEITEICLSHHATLEKSYGIGKAVYNAICSRIVAKRNLYPEASAFDMQSVEGIIFCKKVAILATAFERILTEEGFTSKLTCLRSLDKLGLIEKQRQDTYYSRRSFKGVQVKVLTINLKEILL